MIVVFWAIHSHLNTLVSHQLFHRALWLLFIGLHTALATKDVTVFCFRLIHKAHQPVGCLTESGKDLGGENAIVEGILI